MYLEQKMVSLPVIDLSKCNPLSPSWDTKHQYYKDVSKEFIAALKKYGFLYLIGHGIEKSLIEESFCASKYFFLNCSDIHKKFRRGPGILLGYLDGANEKVFRDKPEDIKQGYDFTLDSEEFQFIPSDYVKDTIQKLYSNFENLRKFILRLIATGLGMEDIDIFVRGHSQTGNINENTTTMRMLYYPPIKSISDVLPDQYRIAEHTDFGTFSMLFQDANGGLQVRYFFSSSLTIRFSSNYTKNRKCLS